MSQPRSQPRTQPRGRVSSTVLVLVVPIFALVMIGAVTGSLAVAWPEIVLLAVVWSVGLAWVWWPRRDRTT
jgi:hypothetical protein